MKHAPFVLAFASVAATAQVDVVEVPSIWAPWSSDIKTECTATLLGANGDGIAQQTVKLGNVFFRQPLFQATFDGQPSAPMAVSGIRLSCKQQGANFDGEGGWRLLRSAPFVVPAGKRLTVAYSPGLQKGEAAFAVGESIPAAVKQGAITGSVPPEKSTTDAAGTVWSLGETAAAGMATYGLRVLRDGQYRAPWHATLIVNRKGQIYFKNAIDQWYAVQPDGHDIKLTTPPF